MNAHRRAAARGVLLFGALGLLLSSCAIVPPAGPDAAAAPSAVGAPSSTPSSAGGSPSAGTPSPADEPKAAASVSVALTGDILWHTSLLSSVKADARDSGASGAYDFGPLFADVQPILRAADVAVCQQETPIVEPGQPVTGYPSFGSPWVTAQAIAELGFDACTTASNHSLDKGAAGVRTTLRALREAGIVPAGTSASETDAKTPRIVTTESGVRVAIVAGSYGQNAGDSAPAYLWQTIKPADMIERGRAARAAGADIVLAAVHAGDEYVTEPNADQTYVSRALAKSGVFDLIYGHHSHTPQPWTNINGTWVVYGVGNLVGQMRSSTPHANEGMIAKFRFERPEGGTRFEVTRAAYVPLLVTLAEEAGRARVLRANADSSKWATSKRLATARERVREAVFALGATGITEE